MNNNELNLKPATVYAFIKVVPLMLLAFGFLLMAYWITRLFILTGICFIGFAWYRFMYIRCVKYLITDEFIRISQGIFFKRIDMVELSRVKDYIITRPFLLQVLNLMNVTLKTTDPENPIVWFMGVPFFDIVESIRDNVNEARRRNRIYELN